MHLKDLGAFLVPITSLSYMFNRQDHFFTDSIQMRCIIMYSSFYVYLRTGSDIQVFFLVHILFQISLSNSAVLEN